MLRPDQPCEALHGGDFDVVLDVEVVLRHVHLGVPGEGLNRLHRHALSLKLAHEGVPAGVRRERPYARDGLQRFGELVAEMRRVAGLVARPGCPEIRRAVCTQVLHHIAVLLRYRYVAHTRRALCRADEHCSLYLFNRLTDVDARAVGFNVSCLERQQLLRAHTCEIQGHKRGVWTGAQAPSASV